MNDRWTAGGMHAASGGTGRGRLLDGVRLPGPWTPVLLLVTAALCVVNLLMEYAWITPSLHFPGLGTLHLLLYVDGEANVPTWFSVLLLFVAAQQLWQVADASRRLRDGWQPYWRVLAVVFAYLSCDELAQFHEASDSPLQSATHESSGYLKYTWVILALPLVAAFAVAYLRFLRALAPRTRNAFLLAGVLYVGAAAGLEMVGGEIDTVYGQDTMAYKLETVVEEGSEMLAITLFAGATSVALRERRAQLPSGTPDAEPAVTV